MMVVVKLCDFRTSSQRQLRTVRKGRKKSIIDTHKEQIKVDMQKPYSMFGLRENVLYLCMAIFIAQHTYSLRLTYSTIHTNKTIYYEQRQPTTFLRV